MIEVTFYRVNWWGNPIYKTLKTGFPIVKLEEGFYSLSDPNDIDSDPDRKLKNNYIKIK